MKGTDILATLPESEPALLPAIWDHIKAGHLVDPVFAPITMTGGGHTITVWVSTDALQLGEPGNAFRFMTSALLEQMIVDALGFYLPTQKVIREAYKQAVVKVEPKTQPAGPQMASKTAMVKHNADINVAAPSSVLVYSSGKGWANDKKLHVNGGTAAPGMACNAGWYTTSAPYTDAQGVHLWQDRGVQHNAGTNLSTDPKIADHGHADYAQTASQIVFPWVLVDGVDWLGWDAVLTSPSLAPAVNDDGALATSRPYVIGTPPPLPVMPHPGESGPSPLVTSVAGIAVGTLAVFGLLIFAGAVSIPFSR